MKTAQSLIACLLALSAQAAPLSFQDIYLELSPEKAQELASRHQRMEIKPMLPAETLEKLGLSSWHRARITDFSSQDADWLNAEACIVRWEPVPDYRTSTWVPDDPGMRAQWHIDKIGVVDAFQVHQGDPGVVIAIVDTGVDYTHPDLEARTWVNAGEDLDGDGIWEPSDMNNIDDDGNGYIDDGIGWDFVDMPNSGVWEGEDGSPPDNDPSDFDGHGTHCAGDAAASGFNGIGVTGVAARCSVMALRAGYLASDGQGYVSHGLEGLLQAMAYGAEIVSMSFGGGGTSGFWVDAQLQADGAGMVMLAAAGNDGSDQIQYPAGYPRILAVGSTRSNDNMSGFSNYGDWVDLGAPGSSILSTTPGGSYANYSGTSMACPVAAGACALLKGLHPDWRGEDMLDALAPFAHPIDGLGIGRIDIGAALAAEARVTSSGVAAFGRLPQNSEADLRLSVRCGQAPIATGTLKVWSNHPELVRDTLELDVGFLAPGGERDLTLPLVYTGTEVKDLELQAELWDLDRVWRGSVQVPCGVTELLLLDGDSSDNWSVAGWYLDAMDGAGLGAEYARSAYQSADELPWIRLSQVLLYTGSDMQPVFDSQLEDSLTAFVERGGLLIISGQQAAPAFSSDFLNLLGVSFTSSNPSGVVAYGVEGNPVSDGMQVLTIGSGGAENQEDPMVLVSAGAEALFTWTNGSTSQIAALKSTEYDASFFGFGLEAINSTADGYTTLGELLAVLLELDNAIEAPGILPAELAVLKAWPNPFNPSLRLAWNHEARSSLLVYNLLGQKVDELALAPGAREAVWQPRGLAAGNYILKLELLQPGLGEVTVQRMVNYTP
jgi:hypothetical protein